MEFPKQMLNIAHRGASGQAPENTLAAFRRAIELGVDGFELDVHLSKDGHLVVIHDSEVSRTTKGAGFVHEMTLDQLKGLDAGSWFNERNPARSQPQFSNERIPMLQEVIDLIKGSPLRLIIELKGNPVSQIEFEEKIVEIISRNKIESQVVVISFDHSLVTAIKPRAPSIPTGVLLATRPLDPTSDAKAAQADVIALSWDCVERELVQTVHRQGLKLFVWTVNDPSDMRRMISEGVDAIMTDYPDVLKEILSSTNF